MKNVLMIMAAASMLILGGCGKGDNGSSSTPAAVPQNVCGTGVPQQYCVAGYNPSAYPNYPYGSSSYYPYGANSGYYVPYYGGSGYGCPYGSQPMYTGNVYGGYSGYSGYGAYGYNSSYTCVSYNYFYNAGYAPYYPSNYAWGNGYVGTGPAQACDSYLGGSCGNDPALTCQPVYGQRYGYCVRH